jgi:hypothetical protein
MATRTGGSQTSVSRSKTQGSAFDGGRAERVLAGQYDVWSRETAARWPNTPRILRDLARNYHEWASREDAPGTNSGATSDESVQ